MNAETLLSMNRKLITGSLIVLLIGTISFYSYQEMKPEKIENEPNWISLNEAIDKASEEEKLIFIDVYEENCQWCQKLKREVYPDPAIRSLLDRNFYTVKIDGNSDDRVHFKGKFITQVEFSAILGVTAYPYLVIMNPEGEVVDHHLGYTDVQGLSRFLKTDSEQES